MSELISIDANDLLSAQRYVDVEVYPVIRGEITTQKLRFYFNQIMMQLRDKAAKANAERLQKNNELLEQRKLKADDQVALMQIDGELEQINKQVIIQQFVEVNLSSPNIKAADGSVKVLDAEFLSGLDLSWLTKIMESINESTFPKAQT